MKSKKNGRLRKPPRHPFALRQGLETVGLSQRQLALRLGVTENYVSRLAHGRGTPSWETACRIAEAAGVSLDVFRGEVVTEGRAAGRRKKKKAPRVVPTEAPADPW